MTLEEKLEKYKKIEKEKTESDWHDYKKEWVISIEKLYQTIMSKWFGDYEEKGLIEFSLLHVKRVEPFIGDYLTSILEMTMANGKTLTIEPIAGITSEYDGKLEFYMLGNIGNRVNILRELAPNKEDNWLIVTSYDSKRKQKFTKVEIEKLIDKWLF